MIPAGIGEEVVIVSIGVVRSYGATNGPMMAIRIRMKRIDDPISILRSDRNFRQNR
jgi:hypothetical protein